VATSWRVKFKNRTFCGRWFIFKVISDRPRPRPLPRCKVVAGHGCNDSKFWPTGSSQTLGNRLQGLFASGPQGQSPMELSTKAHLCPNIRAWLLALPNSRCTSRTYHWQQPVPTLNMKRTSFSIKSPLPTLFPKLRDPFHK